MSTTTYDIHIKNKETKTSWTFVLSRTGSIGQESISSEMFNLLEDSDLEADLKEICDSMCGVEPTMSWNEKRLKLIFDDVEDNEDIESVIEGLREHLEDILEGCTTEDPEED